MAIIQQRMLNLISSAKDYQDAAEKMQAYTRRSARLVATGKSTAEEQLQYLELVLDLRTMLRDPMNSPATLLVEESHFKSHAGRNAAAAKRATRKRRLEGVKTRQQPDLSIKRSEIELEEPWTNTAPGSIAHRGERLGSIDDQTDATLAGVELRVPQASQPPPAGKGKPVFKGPKTAKGLYDDDDLDTGPLITTTRTKEEIAEAIKADVEEAELFAERTEAYERLRDKKVPE